MRLPGLFLLMSAVTACDAGVFGPDNADAPTDLAYQLIPSGDPSLPLGILLQWSPPRSGRAVTYDVYARSSARESFELRATTTSRSFHDAGVPQLDYYVQAIDQDGQELGRTDVVSVDERNRDTSPAADVVLERRDGALWFRAARADARIAQYGTAPMSELTSIDRAPSSGYVDAARVLAGFGYVIRVQYADVHFAAIRVVHVATDFVLFDFAFQGQVGSRELLRATP